VVAVGIVAPAALLSHEAILATKVDATQAVAARSVEAARASSAAWGVGSTVGERGGV
jgi:hypothetical protein